MYDIPKHFHNYFYLYTTTELPQVWRFPVRGLSLEKITLYLLGTEGTACYSQLIIRLCSILPGYFFGYCYIHSVCFLFDSTYKWYHTVSVSVWLMSLNIYPPRPEIVLFPRLGQSSSCFRAIIEIFGVLASAEFPKVYLSNIWLGNHKAVYLFLLNCTVSNFI